jgi:3-hydroxyacyl-[acyl-carrier-protein] dehydratase
VLSKDEICRLIPHRDPFLWIDEVVEESATSLVARKFVSAELDVFRGHYPGRPVLPGVLLCEAAMQAGAVLIARQGLAGGEASDSPPAGRIPVATRINNVKFRHMVRPGDTLEIAVELTERLAGAFFLSARIKVAGKTAAQLDFACALTSA